MPLLPRHYRNPRPAPYREAQPAYPHKAPTTARRAARCRPGSADIIEIPDGRLRRIYIEDESPDLRAGTEADPGFCKRRPVLPPIGVGNLDWAGSIHAVHLKVERPSPVLGRHAKLQRVDTRLRDVDRVLQPLACGNPTDVETALVARLDINIRRTILDHRDFRRSSRSMRLRLPLDRNLRLVWFPGGIWTGRWLMPRTLELRHTETFLPGSETHMPSRRHSSTLAVTRCVVRLRKPDECRVCRGSRGQIDRQIKLDWKGDRFYRYVLWMRWALGCRARTHDAVFFALRGFLL